MEWPHIEMEDEQDWKNGKSQHHLKEQLTFKDGTKRVGGEMVTSIKVKKKTLFKLQ